MKKSLEDRPEFAIEEVEDNELVDVLGGTGCGPSCYHCDGCSSVYLPPDTN